MANLLVLVCDVYCDFVTFPFGILGQVWYLIVLIPDPCCLSYLACQSTSLLSMGESFKIIPEFRILRLTFNRKSASKY